MLNILLPVEMEFGILVIIWICFKRNIRHVYFEDRIVDFHRPFNVTRAQQTFKYQSKTIKKGRKSCSKNVKTLITFTSPKLDLKKH
jgi:hypothetical protein